ncbi:hypothetical protein LCGC14_2686330, partial [marine sediment metagenome]
VEHNIKRLKDAKGDEGNQNEN